MRQRARRLLWALPTSWLVPLSPQALQPLPNLSLSPLLHCYIATYTATLLHCYFGTLYNCTIVHYIVQYAIPNVNHTFTEELRTLYLTLPRYIPSRIPDTQIIRYSDIQIPSRYSDTHLPSYHPGTQIPRYPYIIQIPTYSDTHLLRYQIPPHPLPRYHPTPSHL